MRRASGPKPVAVIRERSVPALLQHLKHRLLDKSIQHRRHSELSHPASVRLVDLDSLDRLRLVGPAQQLFPNRWPVLLQILRHLAYGHPIHARTTLVGLDSSQCLLAVLPLADLFHQSLRYRPGFRRVRFAVSVSVPCPPVLGASLLLSVGKASPNCSGWLFCRLPLMSRADYSPLPLLCLRRTVRAFIARAANTPSADFCRPVRTDHSTLSRESTANGRSPEVSSTAFRTQPPNLQPMRLMNMDFVIICPLVHTRLASYPVLVHRLVLLLRASFRPRLATTPLHFANPSPPSGWAGDLHPQAVNHARHTKKRGGHYPPRSFPNVAGSGGSYAMRERLSLQTTNGQCAAAGLSRPANAAVARATQIRVATMTNVPAPIARPAGWVRSCASLTAWTV